MSKLLSFLVAAVFAVSTSAAFAASHVKAAGEMKKDEMKKEETAAPAKEEMKAPKKAHKAKKAKKEKTEMKKEEMKK